MKKIAAFALLFLACSAPSWSSTSRGFTLIVCPARYTVMQVMFDVLKQRDAVLLSYQGEASTQHPLLHYWTGTAWNGLDVHELGELRFLRGTPARVVMVGDDSLLPVTIKDSLAWLPERTIVTAMDHAGLLNQLDPVFHWSSREWSWFAKRYNLNLQDENREKRNQSWYDKSGPLKAPGKEEYVPALAPIGKIEPEPVEEPVVEEASAGISPVQSGPVAVDAAPAPKDELDEVIEMLEREETKTGEAPAEAFPIK